MKKAIALLVFGIVLMLGPLWGLMGTIAGMIGTFNGIAEKTGDAKAEALAANISFSIYSTFLGIIVCPVGLVLFVISIIWIIKVKEKRTSQID